MKLFAILKRLLTGSSIATVKTSAAAVEPITPCDKRRHMCPARTTLPESVTSMLRPEVLRVVESVYCDACEHNNLQFPAGICVKQHADIWEKALETNQGVTGLLSPKVLKYANEDELRTLTRLFLRNNQSKSTTLHQHLEASTLNTRLSAKEMCKKLEGLRPKKAAG